MVEEVFQFFAMDSSGKPLTAEHYILGWYTACVVWKMFVEKYEMLVLNLYRSALKPKMSAEIIMPSRIFICQFIKLCMQDACKF